MHVSREVRLYVRFLRLLVNKRYNIDRLSYRARGHRRVCFMEGGLSRSQGRPLEYVTEQVFKLSAYTARKTGTSDICFCDHYVQQVTCSYYKCTSI